ncbi:unnamed protein product, partial [Amoebophrya sp. A25]
SGRLPPVGDGRGGPNSPSSNMYPMPGGIAGQRPSHASGDHQQHHQGGAAVESATSSMRTPRRLSAAAIGTMAGQIGAGVSGEMGMHPPPGGPVGACDVIMHPPPGGPLSSPSNKGPSPRVQRNANQASAVSGGAASIGFAGSQGPQVGPQRGQPGSGGASSQQN